MSKSSTGKSKKRFIGFAIIIILLTGMIVAAAMLITSNKGNSKKDDPNKIVVNDTRLERPLMAQIHKVKEYRSENEVYYRAKVLNLTKEEAERLEEEFDGVSVAELIVMIVNAEVEKSENSGE